jgi:spermidine/putrescine transport system ATP-binding protein
MDEDATDASCGWAETQAAQSIPRGGVRLADERVGTDLVEVCGVSKSFGAASTSVRALDDVSVTIGTNEFFTLLGPSGCGKTTLLRLLAGLEHPDTGGIRLGGRDVVNDPPNKRPVNIVFQSYALFPHMSVAQNVAFGLERQGLRGAKVAARVTAMLQLVRLEGLAARRPGHLSGGQQQRVALARALAPQPKLLLLDEPLSALDRELRRDMQVELKRIQRETGITFLLVTHDQEEALSMSDRIAVMDGGRILQVGTPDAIFERPTSRFVATFIGSNVLPGSLLGHPARHVAVRPERVAVTSVPTPGAIAGRVTEITYLGARTACGIALDGGPVIKAERADLPAGLKAGHPVFCRFPLEALVGLASS